MKMLEKIEGWQSKVEFYNDYVIKRLKSLQEVKNTIEEYLKHKNELRKLDETVKRTIKLTKESLKIIKKTNAPKSYFGNPEFLENNKIKQKRAILMSDALKNLVNQSKINDAKKLIDKYIKLILKLWEYKIHELNYKIYSNYGIINDEVILIDFLEITKNKEKVVEYIAKKKWKNKEDLKKRIPFELIEYYIQKMDKNITLNNLEKFWEQENLK